MEEKINALSINNKQLKDRVSVLENALDNKQHINLSTSASGNVTVNNGVIINHHTSVNIQVKDFGNESIEHIGPKESCKVLNSPNMALRSLMELIHFNPEAPEYHNILWTNMQKPIISIKSSDGVNGWSLVNKNDTLEELGLIPEIESRYRSTYFGHIFAGGYSSGYYSYLWTEVLEADAFEAFKEKGLFDKETADKLKKYVFSAGNTDDLMTQYIRFRGKEPEIEPLLKKRGLN